MPPSRPLRIVFAMLSETGHLAGTFGLARALAARGHRVLYLGIADFRELVEAQGFELVPLAEETMPKGYLDELAARNAADRHRGGWIERCRRRRADEAHFRAFRQQILEGPLDERLRSCRADVVVSDTFVWYVALRALRLGLPVVDLSIVLSSRANAAVPPVTSALRPRTVWWSPLVVRASWLWLRLEFLFSKRLASRLFGRFRAPTRMHHLVGEFLQVARRSGYELRENETWWFGEMGPRLALDEIVLCPRAFDLPGAPRDRRLFVGGFVDLDRRETPLDASAIDAAKPMVYCSLGSSPSFYPHAERFFAAVVAVSRERPEWQFVLHVGDHPALERIAAPPSNLLIRARVPQLALLRRASVMVNHGGLNSIQECIQLGVPMVIVPAARDQPGNAVRAVHHGLAVVARMASLDGATLAARIDRAAGDAGIRRNLERLRREIAAGDGLAAAVELIESTAAGARRGS